MAIRSVSDEIDAGRRCAVRGHPARVHAFVRPQLQQRASECVVADAGHIGRARAETRRGDRHVRRVAAEAAYEGIGIPGARRIELDHRFAEGDDVRHRGGVCMFPPNGAARRSPQGASALGWPCGAHCGLVAAGRRGSARNAAA